jgi:hypothetical protein
MKYFIICLLIILSPKSDKCKYPVGEYEVYFKYPENEIETPNYKLVFKGKTYEKIIGKEEKIIGEVKLEEYEDGNCTINLIDKIDIEPVSSLDSLLLKSFGKPLIEFELNEKDTIHFIQRHEFEMNVIINKGLLIKKK